MISIKKILGTICVAGICGAATLANANSLTIVNNTDYYSTTKTNGKMCSNVLKGGSGVTSPHSTNVVKEVTLKTACFPQLDNCIADVFMSNNCSGARIATITFSIKAGIKSVANVDSHYNIKHSGFYVEVNGG